jgi:predicted nucleotidyltransferase
MRYGLTDDTIAQIINVLAKTIKIEKVILFGSRAMGNFREGSDIDLALKGEKLDMADLINISSELEELDLPYYFDLLLFEKIENRDLTDLICRVGVTIYSR